MKERLGFRLRCGGLKSCCSLSSFGNFSNKWLKIFRTASLEKKYKVSGQKVQNFCGRFVRASDLKRKVVPKIPALRKQKSHSKLTSEWLFNFKKEKLTLLPFSILKRPSKRSRWREPERRWLLCLPKPGLLPNRARLPTRCKPKNTSRTTYRS